MKIKLLFIILCGFFFINQAVSSSDAYVTIKDGHFSLRDKRLRLWGVNIQCHHVQDFKGAEITAKRMKEMGFNSVHIWLPRGCFHHPSRKWDEFVKVKKGSQTGLDLFDYLVYCCKKNGLFISSPALSVRGEMITGDVYDLVKRNDIDKNTWLELVKTSGRKGSKHLKFVDLCIKKAYFLKMKYFLNRVNPYTGKKYAEEDSIAFYQLEDEMGLFSWPPGKLDNKNSLFARLIKTKWETFLKQKYGTTEKLKKAWGVLYKNETIDNMNVMFYPGRERKKTPEKRAVDCWTFCYSLADTFYSEYIAELRAQAPKGIGCNVIPLAVDSVIYSRAGSFFNTSKHSTLLCGTGMIGGGALEKKGNLYEWVPLSSRKPPVKCHYSIEPELLKVKDMPYCPVAGADRTNNPYRALTPFFRGIWASFQDWDGVYAYYWGYLPGELKLDSSEVYSKIPLSISHPEGVGFGYEIFNDEINLAVHKLSSYMFRNFLMEPAKSPTVFKFGRKVLYSVDAADYFHHKWTSMAPTAYARSAEIEFDPQGDYDLKWEGDIVKEIECPLKWHDGFEWNWEKGYMKIDTPKVKGYAGFHEGTVTFSDSISLDNISRKFIVFLMCAKDGENIEDAEEIMFCIVSKSKNTGFKEDFSKVKVHKHGHPLWWSVVSNTGGMPVKVDRVACDIILPDTFGAFTGYDFQMRQTVDFKFEKVIKINEEYPIFVGKITCQGKSIFKKIFGWF